MNHYSADPDPLDDLLTAAQGALEALERSRTFRLDRPEWQRIDAIKALRLALEPYATD